MKGYVQSNHGIVTVDHGSGSVSSLTLAFLDQAQGLNEVRFRPLREFHLRHLNICKLWVSPIPVHAHHTGLAMAVLDHTSRRGCKKRLRPIHGVLIGLSPVNRNTS